MTSPWYRCFPRDFNDGMDGLTLEERGAYVTVLNLIYDRGGPIPEEAWWITSKLGCTARVWTRVRAALIVKRKLYVVEIDGQAHLMNERAAREIAEREEFSRCKAEAGRRGGRNSRAKANENNGEAEAQLKHSLSTDQAIHSHIHSSSEANASGGQPPSASQKAWAEAKALLVAQGDMTLEAAGKFFGKLLADYRLEPGDLLGAVGEAVNNGTADPQGWLTKAAQARGKRRQTGPPKRLGFV